MLKFIEEVEKLDISNKIAQLTEESSLGLQPKMSKEIKLLIEEETEVYLKVDDAIEKD